jgi:hypothetical protein
VTSEFVRRLAGVERTKYAQPDPCLIIALKRAPYGMPTTEAETINADLLAFIKG